VTGEAAIVTDQEYSGDYGYDLAHEMKTICDIPAQRTDSTPVCGVRAVPFAFDPDGDFGYDEAHER
jgi:hypothetical protein